MSKITTAIQYGEEQVKLWRRSYDELPPALTKDDKRDPRYDARYFDIDDQHIPLTDSLKETAFRVKDYWNNEIIPQIKSGKSVIIVAHGNSLRALIKTLDNLSPVEVVDLNVPTGIPIVYSLDNHLRPIESYYLGCTKQ